MGAKVLRFKDSRAPRQEAEQGRLKVVQGPDVGSSFVIMTTRITIGRGEENDVVISDLKASRKHCEIAFRSPPGEWIARDLGSANGIQYKGQYVREAILTNGSIVTIGETTLEFMSSSNQSTRLLMAPPKDLAQVIAERRAHLNAQNQKIETKSKSHSVFRNPRILLIFLGIGGFLFLLNLDENSGKKTKKSNQENTADQNLAAYLPKVDTSETNRTIDTFIKAGFREYREKNYLRAKTQFETVLQIAPGHPLATLYLQNSERGLQEEVDFHLERGKTSFLAGKLKESQSHYQAVLRLLYRDQSNKSYVEAKDQLSQVQKAIQEGGS